MSKSWKLVTIGNSGLTIADGNYSSKYPSSSEFIASGIPFIRANNFKNKTIVDDELYFISAIKHAQITKGHLKPKDVLITTRGNIGELAIVPERHDNSNINAQIVLLRCNKDWEPLFLLYVLSSPSVKDQLPKLTTGTALKQLPVKNLKKIQIPLPPLDVQQKIASILDAADTLRQKDKALLAKYDELTQALFLDMFGDPVSNPKGWEKKSFDEMVKFDTKMTKDFDKYGDFLHVGIGNIQKSTGKIIDCLTAKEEKLTSGKYLFDNRHIIYSKIRPNLNKVALPDFTGLCSADSYPLLPIQGISNRVFIAYILRSECFLDFILQHSTRTNIPKANRAQMKLFIGFCPPIELQTQFAERVALIEQQKAQAQASLEKSEELFNSLLQKAFNGELIES